MKKEMEPIERGERVAAPDMNTPIETPTSVDKNLEVSSWIEKIEKRFARTAPQNDTVTDTTTVAQPSMQQPPVNLPVSQKQLNVGKKASIDLGIAWLVTWAIRQIKLITRAGKKVQLKDSTEAK